MRVSAIILILIFVGPFAFLYGRPWLERFPAQDACTFGEVSNAEYRALLAEARARQRSEWMSLGPYFRQGQLHGLSREATAAITSELARRAAELAGNDASIPRQIAASHAVMRALGARYDWASYGQRGREPFDRIPAPNDPPPTGLGQFYLLDIHRVGSNPHIFRHAVVRSSLRLREPPSPDPNIQDRALRPFIDVGMRWPTIDPLRPVDIVNAGPCPPVPSAAWLHGYDDWRRTLD